MVRALLDGKADVDACDEVRMRAEASNCGCGWTGVAMRWGLGGWGS